MLVGRSALTNMLSESKRLFELLHRVGSTRWGCSALVSDTRSDTVFHLVYSCTYNVCPPINISIDLQYLTSQP